MKKAKKAIKRQEEIRDLLTLRGTMTLEGLCETFGCSESTIRNDLTVLDNLGVIKRIYGGAIANESTSRNLMITKRLNIQKDEKDEIAQYVLNEFIKPGVNITLDSGTTNMALAQKILDSQIQCTIVTNSFLVASILHKAKNIVLHLAGGLYDADHASFHDEVAEKMLKTICTEYCFISPNGIDTNGHVTNSGISENAMKKLMVKNSSKVIILADHTKLCCTELKLICTADDVLKVVTDSNASKEVIGSLRDAGFQIVQAERIENV